MGPKSTVQWQSLEEKNIKMFLLKLLKKPESFREEIHPTIASITFAVTHGYTVQKENDPFIPIGKKANADFANVSSQVHTYATRCPFVRHPFPNYFFYAPGLILKALQVQYIPMWMMRANFRREAKEFRRGADLIRDVPYDFVKAEVASEARGIAKPSFTANLIQQSQNLTTEEDFLYKWTSASIFGGATVAAVESFFFAMSQYPEVQAKARDELDRVVGRDFLPSFEDRSNLPYVNALLSEVHRWNPVLPLAIPHRNLEDDTYTVAMGFLIPKGSIVVPNSWAILHDESIYPDPMTFNPERFLNSTLEQPELNPDPRKFAFGYGRRMCPGKDLADDILFISIAMILAAFDIRGPKGARDAETKYTSALLSRPPPFECEISPRSDIVEALIRRSNEEE
ncbi:cytochrome P450 [Favolaschia claudopus]|uniref:Cytochrome P450 n=1 Tax=Favolaschia claudopus TaxID=2862362 RepID=A0AAW0A8V2_9AGAR